MLFRPKDQSLQKIAPCISGRYTMLRWPLHHAPSGGSPWWSAQHSIGRSHFPYSLSPDSLYPVSVSHWWNFFSHQWEIVFPLVRKIRRSRPSACKVKSLWLEGLDLLPKAFCDVKVSWIRHTFIISGLIDWKVVACMISNLHGTYITYMEPTWNLHGICRWMGEPCRNYVGLV